MSMLHTASITETNQNVNAKRFEEAPSQESRRKGGRPKKAPISKVFDGFPTNVQEGAFCCVPIVFFDLCSYIDNFAELKIVQYTMRHTWGFKEYNTPKHITVDEFMHGRKRADGSRMDCGTGLSKSAVLDGLDRALKHGFIECFIDNRDRARVKHYYCLAVRTDEPSEPEPPTRTYFEEEDTYPGQGEPDYPTCCEDQIVEDQIREEATQQESDYPAQEDYLDEYSQDYDPYAGTIFVQSPVTTTPPEQKFFATKNEPTTTGPVVNKPLAGANKIQRSKNRTLESTLRNNDIRIAHSSKNIEEAIRCLPAPDQLPKAKQKAPAFIRNVISDFSRDLNDDEESVRSNISRAAKLYRDSGMNEEDFMTLLYDARATAKRATQVRHKNKHGNPNRMPYFFKCLDGLLHKQTEAIG